MRLGHPVRKKGLGNLTLTGHVEDKKDKVKRIEGRTGVWEYGEKTKKKGKIKKEILENLTQDVLKSNRVKEDNDEPFKDLV